jgi:hypothetical protein
MKVVAHWSYIGEEKAEIFKSIWFKIKTLCNYLIQTRVNFA